MQFEWLSGLIFRLETFVAVSMVLKILGFLARDEIVLRVFVTTGILSDALFYILQPVPMLPPFFSSPILISINLGILVVVVLERTTLAMSDREKRLFQAFQTLSPGQFRTAGERVQIMTEGSVPDALYFIESRQFELRKGGSQAVVAGPAFAGEIACLTGQPASGTVTLVPGTDYNVWPVAALRHASQRSRPLNNALTAWFSLDLARKVADGLPAGVAADLPG